VAAAVLPPLEDQAGIETGGKEGGEQNSGGQGGSQEQGGQSENK
jgi:hypothetical protein